MKNILQNYILVLLIPTLISSCTDKNKDTIYFGGQIVNPNSKSIVLYHNDEPIDTAYLDKENQFLFTLKNANEGLYYFYHQPEHQYIVLEKGDSLLMRLNTLDFDESLVYSGKGAERNNFFIDMFLEDEEHHKEVLDNYQKDPFTFKKELDNIYKERYLQYNNLNEEEHLSKSSQLIVKSVVDFNYYLDLELYTYYHYRKTNKVENTFPEDFYAHRELIDYNNEELLYLRPYTKYLKIYPGQKAFLNALKEHPSVMASDLIRTLDFHLERIKIIDTLITNQDVRDVVLRNSAFTYLLEFKHSAKENKTYMDTFDKIAKNNKFNNEIQELYGNLKSLEKGNTLENLAIVNFKDEKVDLDETTHNRLSVYYFWSGNQLGHLKNTRKRVNSLQKNYPRVNFVGINRDLKQSDWIRAMQAYKLDIHNQYRITNFDSVSKRLVLNSSNKAIVLNKDGTIADGFSDLYSMDLENLLGSYR